LRADGPHAPLRGGTVGRDLPAPTAGRRPRHWPARREAYERPLVPAGPSHRSGPVEVGEGGRRRGEDRADEVRRPVEQVPRAGPREEDAGEGGAAARLLREEEEEGRAGGQGRREEENGLIFLATY
ncbi:hypothetical protein THAOC_31371, partial [Thalassiosira oceanica]